MISNHMLFFLIDRELSFQNKIMMFWFETNSNSNKRAIQLSREMFKKREIESLNLESESRNRINRKLNVNEMLMYIWYHDKTIYSKEKQNKLTKRASEIDEKQKITIKAHCQFNVYRKLKFINSTKRSFCLSTSWIL